LKKHPILLLLVLIFNVSSFSTEEKTKKLKPVLFAAVKGSISDYIPQYLNLEIKDVRYYSNSYFGGSLYIYGNTKGYQDFYIKAEEEILEDFIKKAKEVCKDYIFFGLDHIDVKVTAIKESLLLTASANLVCIDFKNKRRNQK